MMHNIGGGGEERRPGINAERLEQPLLLAPAGDRAIMIRSGDSLLQGEPLQRLMAQTAAWLESGGWTWLEDAVPGYDSVLVIYDPVKLITWMRGMNWQERLKAIEPGLTGAYGVTSAVWELADILLKERLRKMPPLESAECRAIVEIPVRYGGAEGPDLEEAACRSGMSAEAFVLAHCAPIYRVVMIGFLPGFPYLDGLPPELAQPRRDTPRTRVPAGSVGIGGAQTGVYPAESPGGWQLIGRTDVKLVDYEKSRPALLTAGDRIRFVPV